MQKAVELTYCFYSSLGSFPCSSVSKASACNAGGLCSIPELEVSLEKKWQPTPVFLPGESHGQRNLASYSPCGCKEVLQQLSMHTQPITKQRCKTFLHSLTFDISLSEAK